jgi:apolipoprotein N-acyltransferase
MSDEPQPLAPLPRLAWLAAAFALHLALGPGWLLRDGTPLGPLVLFAWALAASRPGRGKRLVDALAFGAMYIGQTNWMGIVFWFAVPWVFVGASLYGLLAGEVCLRVARRLPLALAAPLAWIGAESLLALVPPPLGLSWMRAGHAFSGWIELAGSGRVWGVVGLGWTLLALAGLLADLVRGRGRAPRDAWVAGLLPTALAALLPMLVPAPEVVPGPRLLLVQPAFEQARKQFTGTREELFGESLGLTRDALTDLAEAGERPPDLVCWGETMLPFPLAAPGLAEVVGELEVDPWHPLGAIAPEERAAVLARLDGFEGWVRDAFFGGRRGRGRLLAEGTRFLSGVEVFVAHEGRLRRTNAVVLWEDGERVGVGGKQHLAPGGETMVGLERLAPVRDVIYEVAGYVPDFLPAERTEVLGLGGEGGPWRIATGICFDNAFPDVFAGPVRRERVDLHLVVTNEAWYRGAQEVDQMIAFSKLYGLCTGRSVVRCANSGISAAIGPDGRELARLVVDGRDREVRGTLVVDVPVPADPEAVPPFVLLEPYLLPGAVLAPLVVLLLLRRRSAGEGR